MGNHISWLKGEIKKWLSKKIINDRQADDILAIYKNYETHEIRVIQVLGVLGAVLVAAGVLLFVASNWDLIPKTVKLVLLFGTTFATYYAGWYLSVKKKHEILGKTLLFLASLFVGATIFLTAQIFNVNANAHWLVLLWFVAISPLAYAFDSLPILLLTLLIFSFWFVLYISEDNPFNHPAFRIFMLFLLYGVSLYGAGQAHALWTRFNRFRIAFQGLGLLFILTSYFYFSMETPYESQFGNILSNDWVLNLLVLIFGLGALGSVALSAYHAKKQKDERHEFWVLLLAFLGAIGIGVFSLFADYFIITTDYYGYTQSALSPNSSTILFIIFNLLLFILSIGSLLIGYYRRTSTFVNLGMLFFVIGTIHLYTTTLYEFLPRSLAFVLGGLILLGGGFYLENKRRSIIDRVETEKITTKRFFAIISLPAVVILLFMGIKIATLFGGTDIILKVRPVDPRDIFRGDYVMLGYDISNLDRKLFPAPIDNEYLTYNVFFVLLSKNSNEEWQVDDVKVQGFDNGFDGGFNKPILASGQVCLEGRVLYVDNQTVRAEYGIESYFVPEGKGKDIESARNENRVSALITVNDNCRPILKTLQIDNNPL